MNFGGCAYGDLIVDVLLIACRFIGLLALLFGVWCFACFWGL